MKNLLRAMTKRYILTGTPGSGKTSIINALEKKGYFVVEEAATDVIACEQKLGNREPWKNPDFIDKIIILQKQRQLQASADVQFYDRSPICTYALAVYLRFETSFTLLQEIERVRGLYESQVFFIENLGFCEPNTARTISFEEALKFEKVHLDAYRKFGFECIHIKPASVAARLEVILRTL